MSKSHMEDLIEFHEKFGLEYNGKPRALPKEMSDFRIDFNREELREYITHTHTLGLEISAAERGEKDIDPGVVRFHLEEQLDALVDQVYVIMGTAYLHGYGKSWQEAWDRVHHANMQKVRAQRVEDSTRGSTFDVVKPPGWVKPTHADLVEDNAHAR